MAYPVFKTTLVQLAAGVAKKLLDSPLPGRTQVFIANVDGATVYIKEDNTASASTGYPIPTNTSIELKVGYDPSKDSPQIWGFSTGGTGAGAVRIIECAGPL